MKKRRPVDIIEKQAEKNPNVEHAFLKYPGKELKIPRYKSDEESMKLNLLDNLKLYFKKGFKGRIMHTHPYDPDKEGTLTIITIPSIDDLVSFIPSKAKHDYIIQYNQKTHKAEGYLAISKTKITPNIDILEYANSEIKGKFWTEEHKKKMGDIIKFKEILKEYINRVKELRKEYKKEAVDKVMNDLGLRYKYLPAEGYEVNKEGLGFVKKPENNLEGRITAGIIIGSVIISLIASSSNLTGNVIFNLSNKNSSFIGIGLFIIGLIAGLFWIKTRRLK